jgi:hypothetical protein
VQPVNSDGRNDREKGECKTCLLNEGHPPMADRLARDGDKDGLCQARLCLVELFNRSRTEVVVSKHSVSYQKAAWTTKINQKN